MLQYFLQSEQWPYYRWQADDVLGSLAELRKAGSFDVWTVDLEADGKSKRRSPDGAVSSKPLFSSILR